VFTQSTQEDIDGIVKAMVLAGMAEGQSEGKVSQGSVARRQRRYLSSAEVVAADDEVFLPKLTADEVRVSCDTTLVLLPGT
jgi:hypothetical protein